MSRFNANSAAASIDRPVDEMTLLLRTMSSNLTQESIEHYLSQKNLDIDSVLPSIVNSTFFFRAALLADSDNKFKTYPAVYPDDFEPRERPWYYSSGIKDEITFSDPYKNKLPPYENEITVDMNLFMSINGMQLVEEKGIGEVYNKLQEHNKKLTEAVHESETDTLTGISNRKKFNADLIAAVDKKHPFYLAIIDIDNFKTINDTFGHDIGDIVLTTVCGIGKKVVEDNQGSHIYRYGGEEICVLILSDDEDECFQVLETWRNIINLRKWREEGMHVSFSAGLTKWNEADTPEQLIKRADVCLYNAKTTGKNKIVLG